MRTEFERATRRLLELVVNQLPIGVLVVSATGHRIVANAAARRLVAADVAPSSSHPLMAQLRETLRTGRAEQVRGLGIAPWPSWLPGDAVHVDSQTRPLIDAQGRTIGALLTFADVTTYVLRAQQLEDQMGMVSHDLRTPLGLITMSIRSDHPVARGCHRRRVRARARHPLRGAVAAPAPALIEVRPRAPLTGLLVGAA